MYIPENIKFIFDILENRGYECFAVGGCVRDSIMGITPDDWDFTTSAAPDEIVKCFSEYKLLTIGRKFGTIGVIADDKTYEITTYRTDGDYSDSRHPDKVSFSRDIRDDLLRRDFTINSIAYNEKIGFIDPFGGKKDIEKGIIRCTGDPETRFEEDAIRIMRALRFSSRLGFRIESKTAQALIRKKESLSFVHPQRLKKELMGLIMGHYAHSVLREYASVLSVVIPEIKNATDCNQNNPHHCHDVWNHTITAFSNTPQDEEIRLCVIYHDLGKPFCKTTDSKGIDHFKGHQSLSATIAEKSLTKFGFSRNLTSHVTELIRFHDERFKNGDSDIKRVLAALGEDLFLKLMTVAKADILGQSEYKREEKLNLISSVEKRTREIIDNNECYSLQTLKITGFDIEKLGFKGKIVGDILSFLLKSVMKGECLNDKDILVEYIKEHFVDK